MVIYVDASAALKAVIKEAESASLIRWLADAVDAGGTLVSSWLLHTEMHCAAQRHPQDVDTRLVDQFLDAVDLVDLTRGDLLSAPALGHGLRTLDALHLTTAMRLASDVVATYDQELAEAARQAGLTVAHPA